MRAAAIAFLAFLAIVAGTGGYAVWENQREKQGKKALEDFLRITAPIYKMPDEAVFLGNGRWFLPDRHQWFIIDANGAILKHVIEPKPARIEGPVAQAEAEPLAQAEEEQPPVMTVRRAPVLPQSAEPPERPVQRRAEMVTEYQQPGPILPGGPHSGYDLGRHRPMAAVPGGAYLDLDSGALYLPNGRRLD